MTEPKGFQVIVSEVVLYEDDDVENGTRLVYGRGEIIPAAKLSKAARERYLELQAIRPASKDAGELPPPNAAAVPPVLTTPAGDEIENAEEVGAAGEFTPAKSHAEADQMATDLGVTFPGKAKLDEKNEALAQIAAARAAAGSTGPPTREDLAEMSEGDLVQRGIDYGLAESELVELSKDELVLKVAEAMNLVAPTPAAQAAQNAAGGQTEPE